MRILGPPEAAEEASILEHGGRSVEVLVGRKSQVQIPTKNTSTNTFKMKSLFVNKRNTQLNSESCDSSGPC